MSGRQVPHASALRLPLLETDYAHPRMSPMGAVYGVKDSRFVEMQKHGVAIPEDLKRIMQTSLFRVWQSWHPEEAR